MNIKKEFSQAMLVLFMLMVLTPPSCTLVALELRDICNRCTIAGPTPVDDGTYYIDSYVNIEAGGILSLASASTLRIQGEYLDRPVITNTDGELNLAGKLVFQIRDEPMIRDLENMELTVISGSYSNNFDTLEVSLPNLLEECFNVEVVEQQVISELYTVVFQVTETDISRCRSEPSLDSGEPTSEASVIAGIIIACVLGVFIVVIIGLFAIRKCKTRPQSIETHQAKSTKPQPPKKGTIRPKSKTKTPRIKNSPNNSSSVEESSENDTTAEISSQDYSKNPDDSSGVASSDINSQKSGTLEASIDTSPSINDSDMTKEASKEYSFADSITLNSTSGEGDSSS